LGRKKIWCPRCDQGWVVQVYIKGLEQHGYLCDECEALWFDVENITQFNFVDYSTFMEAKGFGRPYEQLKSVDRE
jgi:transcription elongation factor Elf1